MSKNTKQEILLKVPAVLKGFTTLMDGGIKLVIITRELIPEDATLLLKLVKKSGWFVFKQTNIAESDVANLPTELKEFKGDKTPSQRLRAVIYRLWEQTDKSEEFNDFYNRHLGAIIEQYKSKLD